MKKTTKRIVGLTLAMVGVMAVTGCGGKSNASKDPTYTYHGAFTLSPDTFNPLQYKSTTDSVPLDYTTNSLYEFAYNEAGTGFDIVPVMAAEDPIDVTENYLGKEETSYMKTKVDFDTFLTLSPSKQVIGDIEDDNNWEEVSKEDYDAYIAKLPEFMATEDYTDTLTFQDYIDFYGYTAEELYDLGLDENYVEYYIFNDFYESASKDFAFRIKLNQDAKWDNGDAINADDYIYTMQALLDPDMNNYRASNYYAGSVAILNAKAYLYSGKTTMMSDCEDDGVYAEGRELYVGLYSQADLWVNSLAGYGYGDSIGKFYEDYFLATYKEQAQSGWDSSDYTIEGKFPTAKESYKDYEEFLNDYVQYKFVGDGKSPLREATYVLYNYLKDTKNQVSDGTAKGYCKVDSTLAGYLGDFMDSLYGSGCSIYYPEMCHYITTFPKTTWDQVGLKKIDDYTIDIIYTGELSGFYQKYNIGLPLVHKATYEKTITTDPTTGAKSSNYGTSVETYMGYGPYKLTKYVVDSEMVFEKSDTWFGYTEKYADTYGTFTAEFDGQEHQQYQTTKVVLKYVPNISTREEMFLAGQLSSFGMTKNEYDKYKSSDRLYSATGAATFYGIICSDYNSLVEREATLNKTTYSESYDGSKQQYNKTILTIKEFRQALCYGIDRKTLVANLYPGGSPAISLFSDLIIADPEKGIPFNGFDSTKEAICSFWGVEYGPEEEFKTLDEAYNSITGYDLTTAKKLVDEAYDKAIEQGLMGANTIVNIDYCASTDSETEQLWYNTFNSSFEEMFKGTKLEGKFQYNYNTNLGSDFGGAIQSGKADTAWGFGWSGGELDPYDLLQVYVDAANGEDEPYQYDMWIDRSAKEYTVTLNLDVDGKGEKEYSYTVFEWYKILNGVDGAPDGLNWKYQKIDDSIRAEILAACEELILNDYTTIPLMNEGSVLLLSYQVNYGKESYLFGMGFGGIRYITYNFSDTEWTAYVNKQSGKTLKY